MTVRPHDTLRGAFEHMHHSPDHMGRLTMQDVRVFVDSFEFVVNGVQLDLLLGGLDINWDEDGVVRIIFDAGEFLALLLYLIIISPCSLCIKVGLSSVGLESLKMSL